MNWKFWIYTIAVFLGGILIGGVFSMRYQNNRIKKAELGLRDANYTIDSLIISNEANKKVTDRILEGLNKNISNHQNKIDKRNEEFKKDTVILSSDELLQRVRAVAGNNND